MGDSALCELVMQLRSAYDFPMTHLLADRVLDADADNADRGRILLCLAADYLCSIEECIALSDYCQDQASTHSLPKVLRDTVDECRIAIQEASISTAPRISMSAHSNTSPSTERGVSIKKQHEIKRVVELLTKIVSDNAIDAFIDVGCGLGHLARSLRRKLPHVRIVGVECEQRLCESAHRQLDDLNVDIVRMCVGKDTAHELYSLAEPNMRACLVSLHGCADLQPTLLRLFADAQSPFKALVSIGCCYHRMHCEDSLPMSGKYTLLRLSDAARRLATQQSPAMYTQRVLRAGDTAIAAQRNRLYLRNVQQTCAQARSFKIRDHSNYQAFLADVERQIGHECASEMAVLIKQQQDKASRLLAIEVLQTLVIQPLLEAAILSDRIAYCHENSLSVFVSTLFDAQISPRNTALVMMK